MSTLVLLLLLVALVLLFASALGVANQRVQLQPLALGLALLAYMLRLWPP